MSMLEFHSDADTSHCISIYAQMYFSILHILMPSQAKDNERTNPVFSVTESGAIILPLADLPSPDTFQFVTNQQVRA